MQSNEKFAYRHEASKNCSDRKIICHDYPASLQPLKSLLAGSTTRDSQNFMKNIRAYSNSFARTSFGAKDNYAIGLAVCSLCHMNPRSFSKSNFLKVTKSKPKQQGISFGT